MQKILIVLIFCTSIAHAQNVGIGTINPVRAKLEVHGVAGSGATNAIFSAPGNAGISLQQNWPTIGFNQYRDLITPGTQGRRMAGGFASIWTFDYTSGNMAIDMYGNGAAETFTGAGNISLHITNNGNIGIRNSASPYSSLWVSKIASNLSAVTISGIVHSNQFMFGAEENTFIRGGYNGSRVILNDIPRGRVNIATDANLSSTLNLRGSESHNLVRTTASSYSFTDTDYELYCDMQNTASKLMNVNLPPPTPERDGRVYRIVALNLPKIDADNLANNTTGFVNVSGLFGDDFSYQPQNPGSGTNLHRLFFAESVNLIGTDYRWIRTAISFICVEGKWLKLEDNESLDTDF